MNNSNKTNSDLFVSFVVVYNKNSKISIEFVQNALEVASANFLYFEILFIDNGLITSKVDELSNAISGKPGLRLLSLTREFSVDAAIFAGIEACIGDRVVLLMPETDNPINVPDLVKVLSDTTIDIAQWVGHESKPSRNLFHFGRKAFFDFNKRFLGLDISSRTSYLTVLSRRAIQALTDTSRSQRYFRHLVTHIGYPIHFFEYFPENETSNSRSLLKNANRAIEMVSSYSTKPLRLMTGIGLFAATSSVFYAGYVIYIQFTDTQIVEGWTTTSLQIALMFFVISLVLAVQSEYIGRILTESRKEPPYILKEELESEIPVPGLEKRNVDTL